MSDAQPRRPMIFQHDHAFARLKDRGMVVTARSREHPTGPIWVRRSRTAPKEFDAHREHLESYPNFAAFAASSLCRGHYNKAGFSSWRAWADAVKEMQDGIPSEVHVYRVTRE